MFNFFTPKLIHKQKRIHGRPEGVKFFSLMAVPKALVLGCNTHGPAPWVSCMTARGEEEEGGTRKSAMCSQTLRGAAVGAVLARIQREDHKSAGRSN